MTDEQIQIAVREPTNSDTNFITNSWLESFRQGGYMNATVPNRVYFNQHHRILEKIVPRSRILVACNSTDTRQVFGWICAELMDRHLVIHYIYIKDDFRQMGIASRLVRLLLDTQDVVKNVILTTHQTWKSKVLIQGRREWDLKPMAERHGITALYNPYMLFYSLPEGWEE